MFSNLPALILVVLIMSQISYNMVYLECAFNYGDLVLPSCKGSSPPPIISFIYFMPLCCVSASRLAVILCLLSSLEDVYYLAIILMHLS